MKLPEFREELEKNDLNTFLIYNPINVLYFTGFFSQSLVRLIIPRHGTPVLIVPEMDFEEAKSVARDCKVIKFDEQNTALKLIKNHLEEEFKAKNCGIEQNYMTISDYKEIIKEIKGVEFNNGVEMINKLRRTKLDIELKYLREAARIADIGMQKALESIKPGATELEIAALLEHEIRKNGSEPIPFDTIIASGPRAAFPHAKTTTCKIKQGDLVIIDCGASYNGYVSDTSRTISIGKPTEKQEKIYNLVLKAQLGAENQCHAGMKAKDLDIVARDIIKDANYGDYFVHSLGHGVGLEVHESPTISLKNKELLEINNIITIEPGLYIPNFGGVRLEDTVVVKKDKCEILNKTPKKIY